MLHESHLMIMTTEGKEVTFTLGEDTKYTKGGKPATKDDLTKGVRVSVLPTADGKGVVEVKIGERKAE